VAGAESAESSKPRFARPGLRRLSPGHPSARKSPRVILWALFAYYQRARFRSTKMDCIARATHTHTEAPHLAARPTRKGHAPTRTDAAEACTVIQIAMFAPDISSASTGQIRTHNVQLTHAAGRGSQGNGPAISRQSTGQTTTHSPQPIHRRSSSTGRSSPRITSPLLACVPAASSGVWRYRPAHDVSEAERARSERRDPRQAQPMPDWAHRRPRSRPFLDGSA
jgi:hypothetical protein